MGGDATTGVWWEHISEFVFLDYVILVTLMFIAVVAEFTHEFMQHRIEHKQGKYTTPLWHRVNSEFMVLGFLAFIAWVVSRSGGFVAAAHLVESFREIDGQQLLHLVEDVHMRLFMTMLLYFIILCVILFRAERYMRGWCFAYESVELRKKLPVSEYHLLGPNPYISKGSEAEFLQMSIKFSDWLQHHDFKTIKIEGHRLSPNAVRDLLKDFNLAAYLTASLEEILIELVHIKIPVWIGVALLYLTMGLTSGYLPVSDQGELWKILAVVFAVMLVLLLMLGYIMHQYRWVVGTGPFAKFSCWGRWHVEIVMTRLLQIGLFFCCYSIIWFVTAEPSRYQYLKSGENTALIFAGYWLPFFLVVLFLIPYLLPRFSIVFRLPPYVDRSDIKAIVQIAMGRYHRGYMPRMYPAEPEKGSEEESDGIDVDKDGRESAGDSGDEGVIHKMRSHHGSRRGSADKGTMGAHAIIHAHQVNNMAENNADIMGRHLHRRNSQDLEEAAKALSEPAHEHSSHADLMRLESTMLGGNYGHFKKDATVTAPPPLEHGAQHGTPHGAHTERSHVSFESKVAPEAPASHPASSSKPPTGVQPLPKLLDGPMATEIAPRNNAAPPPHAGPVTSAAEPTIVAVSPKRALLANASEPVNVEPVNEGAAARERPQGWATPPEQRATAGRRSSAGDETFFQPRSKVAAGMSARDPRERDSRDSRDPRDRDPRERDPLAREHYPHERYEYDERAYREALARDRDMNYRAPARLDAPLPGEADPNRPMSPTLEYTRAALEHTRAELAHTRMALEQARTRRHDAYATGVPPRWENEEERGRAVLSQTAPLDGSYSTSGRTVMRLSADPRADRPQRRSTLRVDQYE